MNKAEVLELKRQYKINNVAATRIAGCYIDAEKNVISTFNDSFLSKPEEEVFKYLEIFKKGLSGSVGKNIRTFDVEENETTRAFKTIIDAELGRGSAPVLDAVYAQIAESLSEKVENFLILLTYNAYDIPNKNKDNLKDGESYDVYSYITGYICPVKLEKAGLSYNKDEKVFGVKELRRCVDMPEFTFIYPSFEDRSSDYDKITVYTKTPDSSYDYLIKNFLACNITASAAEQKELFNEIIEQAVADSSSTNHIEVIKKVSESIAEKVEEEGSATEINTEDIKKILQKNNVNTSCVDSIAGNTSFTGAAINSPDMDIKMDGISVKVKSEMSKKLERRIIDGKEYILIAVDGDPLVINGITVE